MLAGSYGTYGGDAWLVKTDSAGNKEWDRIFGGTGFDFCCSVQQTSDGGYVLGGFTESYGAGEQDAWLIKCAGPNALAVSSISPKSGVQNWPVSVTNLAGKGFKPGATVRLEQGSNVINATNVVVIDERRITCRLTLKGPMGKCDVVVKNPDGQEGRLAGGFSVTDICGRSGGTIALGLGLLVGLFSLGGLRRHLLTAIMGVVR